MSQLVAHFSRLMRDSCTQGLGALHDEEVARARTFAVVLLVLCINALILLPFLGGETEMAIGCGVGLVALALTCIVVLKRTKRPSGYTRTLFRTFGLVAVAVSTLLLFHLGLFSPTPLVVSMGILFFAQGSDRAGAVLICGSAIACYMVGALLISVGMLPDLGVIPGGENLTARLFFVWHVPLVHLVCTVQGLSNRVAVEDLEARLTRTSRQLGIEQVRFEELRQQFNAAAMQVGSVRGPRSGTSVGRYFLGSLIGRGGTAEIYASENMQDGEEGALKVLYSGQSTDQSSVTRFRREADLAATVKHPNVVRIRGHGQTEDGLFYLCMERLWGQDLSARLRDRPRMSRDDLECMVRQVAEGLTAVHEVNIVHRDIQPRNLFWVDKETRGCWKLLDFGIARRHGSPTLTRDEIMGTPGYMSPEQASCRRVDHRSDLFSFGAVIYRALLGRPPYWSSSPILTVSEIALGRPLNPRLLDPEISSALMSFLVIALAYSPCDRFQTATGMQMEFERAMDGRLSEDARRKAERLLFRRGWASQSSALQTMRFLPAPAPGKPGSESVRGLRPIQHPGR